MADVTVDIKDLLVSAGIGIFGGLTGWNITIGGFPASPHQSIMIIRVGGRDRNPKYALDHPSIQILIRGNKEDYLSPYNKAEAIYTLLLGLPPQTVNSTYIVGVYAIGDILQLTPDESRRFIFSTNWRIIRQPPVGTGNRTALPAST